jgi:hypothetical protein
MINRRDFLKISACIPAGLSLAPSLLTQKGQKGFVSTTGYKIINDGQVRCDNELIRKKDSSLASEAIKEKKKYLDCVRVTVSFRSSCKQYRRNFLKDLDDVCKVQLSESIADVWLKTLAHRGEYIMTIVPYKLWLDGRKPCTELAYATGVLQEGRIDGINRMHVSRRMYWSDNRLTHVLSRHSNVEEKNGLV